MAKFKMKAATTAKAAKAATESSGGIKRFKWDDNRLSAELLILGEIHEGVGAVFTSKNHEYWSNGKVLSRSGTPSYSSKNGGESTGEEDKLVTIGWKLRDKYQNSSNEKKKGFWRNAVLNTQHHCLVLDLKNIEAGPLVFTMPNTVSDVVLEEIKEVGDDLTSICDFDQGRILYIKSNGEKGKKRRYKIVKFKDAANLIADGVLDDDMIGEIAEKAYNLSKMQLAYSEDAYEKHFDFVKKAAAKLGIDLDEIGDEEEEEIEESEEGNEEEMTEDDLGIDEEELNLDEEESEEDEIEEEEVKEEPKKKVSSRRSRR